MCAIVDANISHELFGSDRRKAGVRFLEWIEAGSGRLFVSRQLLAELDRTPFQKWARDALRYGKMQQARETDVAAKTLELQDEGLCASNDSHILALAIVSGARLLYSNDTALQQDFKNKRIIDHPRGKVYSTLEDREFQPSHQRLLRRKDLCRA